MIGKPLNILQQYWGHASFRPLQEDIIESVLAGNDTLALLPTGGGKSICFQVPAMCLEGICIVVSPLIALMKDQVEQLRERGIKAAAIFSGMSKREIDLTLDNCIYGAFKFLYVSPERLKTELFLARAKQMNICLLAVDEAHCISQWGYDFRPPYLEIAAFQEVVKSPKLIALTATATREVKEDIISRLSMGRVQVFQKSFARANLSYAVFQLESKTEKLLQILQNVPGSGVVYVRSRKKTREVADMLRRQRISADFYHAGLSGKERSQKQDAWIENKVRVMVATNAFGMGIDKPDVRTVVHLDLPDSLEAYYQEAGRGGRDEKRAYAVALFHQQDIEQLLERAEKSVVSFEQMQRTYQALANFYKVAIGSHEYASFSFDYEAFIKTFNLPALETYQALRKMSDEGILQLNEGFFQPARAIFILSKPELYKYQVANPNLDNLIKAMMRLYGGEMFNGYVRIKESDLVSLTRSTQAVVKKQLMYLQEQQVIDYQPASDTPTITFLTPRLDPEKLPIDTQMLAWRKKMAIEKAQQVAAYMQSDSCRTQIFQRYFGEDTDEICGTCDNDLAQRTSSSLTSPLPIERVLKLLVAGATLLDLKKALPDLAEDVIVETLRVLVNDQRIVQDQGVFLKKQL